VAFCELSLVTSLKAISSSLISTFRVRFCDGFYTQNLWRPVALYKSFQFYFIFFFFLVFFDIFQSGESGVQSPESRVQSPGSSPESSPGFKLCQTDDTLKGKDIFYSMIRLQSIKKGWEIDLNWQTTGLAKCSSKFTSLAVLCYFSGVWYQWTNLK